LTQIHEHDKNLKVGAESKKSRKKSPIRVPADVHSRKLTRFWFFQLFLIFKKWMNPAAGASARGLISRKLLELRWGRASASQRKNDKNRQKISENQLRILAPKSNLCHNNRLEARKPSNH